MGRELVAAKHWVLVIPRVSQHFSAFGCLSFGQHVGLLDRAHLSQIPVGISWETRLMGHRASTFQPFVHHTASGMQALPALSRLASRMPLFSVLHVKQFPLAWTHRAVLYDHGWAWLVHQPLIGKLASPALMLANQELQN